MPDLIIEGRRIGYGCNVDAIDASQTVLLLIHGSGGDRGDWQWQLEGIKAPGGVIAIELPGHGESDGPGESSVPVYADWVEKFVLGLGLQRVALMGCSLGSAISQWIGLERKPWMVALGLVGAGARLRVLPSLLDGLINEPALSLSSLADFCLSQSATDSLRNEMKAKYQKADPYVIHGDLSACDKFDVIGRIHEISVPTLILVGAEDYLTPVKYSKFLNDKIPGSTMVTIPNAGHLAMMEKPEEFNAATQNFLDSL